MSLKGDLTPLQNYLIDQNKDKREIEHIQI